MPKHGSLTGCIDAHGKNTKELLPKAIIDAAVANDQVAMNKLLKQHIEHLASTKRGVDDQQVNNLTTWIENSTANSLVNRKDDPFNELNTFTYTRGLVNNVVQIAKSFGGALASKFLKRNKITAVEKATLLHFHEGGFHGEAVRALQKIFKYKKGKSNFFRSEDPIQYLFNRIKTKDGYVLQPYTFKDSKGNFKSIKLDPVISSAIASAAYEWLGGEGGTNATGQTEQSLKQLLGIPKGGVIPEAARNELMNVGADLEATAASIGKLVIERLSITDTNQSDALLKAGMEKSAGYTALAMMEEMGLTKREHVFTGQLATEATADVRKKYKEGKFGIASLLNNTKTDTLFYTPSYDDEGEVTNKRAGLPTRKFINLTEKAIKSLKAIQLNVSEAPEAFNKLFGNEARQPHFSWKDIPLPKVMNIGRSKLTANKLQQDNLQKYTNIQYDESTNTMGIFTSFLDKYNPEDGNSLATQAMDKILGKETMDGKLNTRSKSVEGTNRGVDRDIDAVRRWLDLANNMKERGKDSTFRIGNEFMNNMRMLQKGLINPQNSKIHRNLFAPKSWRVTFDTNDQVMERKFKEGIALAFGIESGKVGGVKNQIGQLDDILEGNSKELSQPVLYALMILDNMDQGGEVTAEAMMEVANAVELLGEKVHSFKGLVELARFNRAKDNNDTAFTTDIYKEIDGVSNGPILGILQLIPDSADKQALLATLAMGGISINPEETNLDELLGRPELNDAYQRMGEAWAREVEQLKAEYKASSDPEAKIVYQQALAAGAILGKFTNEEGVIESVVRKLSKPRTMQTIYGAGTYRQTQILTSEDIIENGIYKQMEKFMGKESDNLEGFEEFIKDINTLAGTHFTSRQYKTDGKLDPKKMQKFFLDAKASTQVNDAVSATYGKAMKSAIDQVYGDVIAARQPLNDTVQLTITVYNLVLKAKIDAAVKAKKDVNTDTTKTYFSLTKAEIAEIQKEMAPLFPQIKTPIHSSTDPSYLPLANAGMDFKNRKFVQVRNVTQQYAPKAFPQLSGDAQGIPYLDPAKMAPMVKTIQMLDSMVANHLMGLYVEILNNHDGFSHSIMDSDVIRKAANKRLYEIMSTYSIGEQYNNMHKATWAAGKAALEEAGVTPAAIWEQLKTDGVITLPLLMNMFGTTEEYQEAINNEFELLTHKDTPDKLSKADATKYFMDKVIKDNAGDKPSLRNLINLATEQISKDSEAMAEQTTRNLKEVMKSVTEVQEYPDGGKGWRVENQPETTTTFGLASTSILTVDADNMRSNATTTADLVAETIDDQNRLYSGNEQVSTTPADYPSGAQKINSQNLTQVFDIMSRDEQNSRYQGKVDSDDHKNHLKRILDNIVGKVMTPVEFFMDQHNINTHETMGLFQGDPKDPKNNKIWLQTQQLSDHPQPGMLSQGIRMSAGEVYTHEMVHHITHTGLLTPGLRKQAYMLYNTAYAAFKQQHGAEAYKVFLNDPSISIASQNPYEVQAAKDRWKHVFETVRPAGDNKGIEEFIAMGLTNENFIKELSTLTIPDSTIKARKALSNIWSDNLQTTIVNFFSRIMDIIRQTVHNQQHSTQMNKEIENLAIALGRVDGKAKSVIYDNATRGERALTAWAGKADEKVKATATKAMDKFKLGKLVNKTKKLPSIDNLVGYNLRAALAWYNNKEAGLAASIVTEMKGGTDRLKNLHELLTQRNLTIDSAKTDAMLRTQDFVNTWFAGKKLKPVEKTAITKAALKTDLSSLTTLLTDHKRGMEDMADILNNDIRLEQRISQVKRNIYNHKDMSQFLHFFENAADDLGYFMVHSDVRNGGVPMHNAYNIVLMHGTKHANALAGENFDLAVKYVDQLASLSALRYVSKNDRNIVATLLTDHESGMESTLSYHETLKENALRDNFSNNPSLMQKGYVKTTLNPRINIKQAPLSERRKLEEQSYQMVSEEPIGRDIQADKVKDNIYLFVAKTGTPNDLNSGILSTKQLGSKGTTMFDVQVQLGNTKSTAKDAHTVAQQALNVTRARLNKMFNPRPLRAPNNVGKDNYLVPKFNGDGDISSLRYIMNEHTKDTILEQSSEFDRVFGLMTGTIIEKVATPKINSDLISALKDLADHKDYGIAAQPEIYVEISPFSSVERYRDIYRMIPNDAQRKIVELNGESKLMVPRDVVDLAFGQRQYSLLEMFGKDKKDMNLLENILTEGAAFALGWINPFAKNQATSAKGRAALRTKRIEEVMMQLTRIGKTNIVVRNIGVTHGNYMSNIAYLKSKGIPLEDIRKNAQEAITGAIRYQQDSYSLGLLKDKRNLVERKRTITAQDKAAQLDKLDRKIIEIEDMIAKNPTTEMIDKGFLPQIVDDVAVSAIETAAPHKYGADLALDKALGMLPGKAQKLAKALFMTDDTQGYKMLNNAVKMTDYVGRYALYKHYMEKGMTDQDAKSAARDEFINFELPTHRLIEYGNNIGFIWFSKYQLRVLKDIKNLVLDKPFTTLATFMVSASFGNNNILNSLPFITKDPTQGFGNAVSTMFDSVHSILNIDLAEAAVSPMI